MCVCVAAFWVSRAEMNVSIGRTARVCDIYMYTVEGFGGRGVERGVARAFRCGGKRFEAGRQQQKNIARQ